jgi:hypothetical protein
MSESLPADWEASSLRGVAKWGSGGTSRDLGVNAQSSIDDLKSTLVA